MNTGSENKNHPIRLMRVIRYRQHTTLTSTAQHVRTSHPGPLGLLLLSSTRTLCHPTCGSLAAIVRAAECPSTAISGVLCGSAGVGVLTMQLQLSGHKLMHICLSSYTFQGNCAFSAQTWATNTASPMVKPFSPLKSPPMQAMPLGHC